MINVLCAIFEFLLEYFWSLVAIMLVLVYGRTVYKDFIFTPLAGGNGKIQMDELAKGIVLAILIWAVHRDGYRTHEWTYFTDAFYAALLAAIFAIASIKPVTSVLNAVKKKDTPTQNPTQDVTHPIESGPTSTPV